jgi:hypothetical protein
MESIKLKTKYLDTQGVYDSNAGKTQDEINAGKVNTADYNPDDITPTMTKPVGKDGSGKLWTEPVESAEVASATGNWLSEHITQETGYVIDDSLSVTGAAADAKVTGDKLREVTTNFDNLFKIDINWSDYATTNKLLGWHRGLYDNTGATYNATLASTKYICCNSIVAAGDNYNYLFAKAFPNSDGSYSYGILITEYDANGNYITTHGTGTGTNRTIQQMIEVYPTHLYGFSIGHVGRTDANSLITEENIGKIQAYFFTSCKTEVDPTNDINKNCVESSLGGHVVEYKTVGKPMEIYKNVNGQAEYSFSVPASDYIRCNSNYTYNLLINPKITDAKYYINIYDRSHNIDLTYSRTNGEGIINCFTAQELANYNGFQFSNLPDGYYIRYSISPYDTEYRMYVWDGVRCGLPLCSEMKSFSSSTTVNVVDLPESGESVVTIPGGCKCVIVKPGYTFVDLKFLNIDEGELGSGKENKNAAYHSLAVAAKPMRFPSQICYLSDNRVYFLVIRKNYNYETGEYSTEHAECDMSPYICVIPSEKDPGVFSTDTGFGRIDHIIRKIKDIENLKWECKVATGDFKAGVIYHGVPYRTDWTRNCYFGWHISSRTFINAVNDEDSVFYTFTQAKSSTDDTLVKKPYYCLVCSAYGTLVSLFPYPSNNFSMVNDPNFQVQYSSDYEIGGLLSDGAPDGTGHCIVPIAKTQNSGSQLSAVTFAEASGKSTRRRNYYNSYFDRWGQMASASGYYDSRRFVYNIKYLKEYILLTPYNTLPDVEPTNGSARPHKGDCSVYTSYGDIIINIKDLNADRIYYQKVSCSFDDDYPDGIPTSVNDVAGETANYILLSNIKPSNQNSTNNSKQITLRSKTTLDNDKNTYKHTGAIVDAGNNDLESGAIYAVWASNGESTRPNNEDPESTNKYELFEWHDLSSEASTEKITYDIVDGKLVVPDAEFWYARG